MIISASRRTDIPKFYALWFMNRIRAGFCTYPNPFNRKQVVRLSLTPADLDVIVFWTKDPRPLMRYLDELDQRGYRYYFQFTVNGYPRAIEPHVPALPDSLETFKELARRITPKRVIWRYDPIIWAAGLGEEYHAQRFSEIAKALKGYTARVVVSLVDDYRGAGKRMAAIEGIRPCTPEDPAVASLLRRMSAMAQSVGMEIVACAEPYDLLPFGIRPGKCVDDELIHRVFGVDVTARKDPSQRSVCGCVLSRDIGVYGTCHHGCVYCYATGLQGQSLEPHDPTSPSLVGHYEPAEAQGQRQAQAPGRPKPQGQARFEMPANQQLPLFDNSPELEH